MRFVVVSLPAARMSASVPCSSCAERRCPLLLGLDERGQEVFGRLPAALLGEPGHVAVELVDRLPQHLGAGGGKRVEKADQMVRPALEGREVARQDAEHLGNDRHRERHREVANDVELAAARERRQQPVGQLLDAGTELLERPWSERLRHELPEPRVVGRVATQHRGLVGLIRVGEPVGDLPRALLGVAGVVPVVGGEPTVAQDGEAVGVAEEEPAADGTAAVDRVALAEALVQWIRPFACLTEEGVEERVEDVSRLHALGDDGATDARQLSADAQRPRERAHVAEPIPKARGGRQRRPSAAGLNDR